MKNNISIIPTGIDIDNFRHQHTWEEDLEIRRKYGIGAEDFLILSLGRISKEKDIDAIIRQMPQVVAALPDAKLLIVGDGPFRKALEMMTDEMNMSQHVIFAGQVPFEEVGRFYSAADLFANASQSETQGLTILEAMASELPVVVYDDLNVEGLVIEGETGRLFSQEQQLGTQIIDAYMDRTKTQAMTLAGRDKVSQLSKEIFAEKVEELYSRMLSPSYASVV